MAGEAEWEALPDVVSAEPQAPAAEWESLPDVVAPEKVQEFPEVDLTVDPAVESRNAVLRTAFDLTKKKQGPELARATELARTFGVPVTAVLPNLPQFEYAVESSNFDPDEFYKKNRELVDVMGGSPEQLATVVTSPTVGPIISALRKVDDWYQRNFGEGFRAFDAMAQAGADAAQKGQTGSQIVESMTAAADTANTEAAQQTEKQRNAKVAMKDTPEAKAIRSTEGIERTLLTVRQRYREGRASTSMGYAGFDVMMAENAPNPDPERVAETAARVQDLRAASTPLYLGETENQRIAGDAIQGLISTADGLLARGAAGAAGAVAGAAAGAVAGAASGRSASAAIAGAKEGAKFGATQGQRIGGAYHGFKAEAGSKYLELRDAVTDEGQKLSSLEAAGGAVAYGLVAGYLETMGFEAQAAPLKSGIKRLLSGDPLFRRRLAELGAEWLKGAGTEGLTEGLQAMASQVFEYVVKSEKDWKLQKGPIANLEDSVREGQVGFLSALVMGGGSSVGALAVEAITTDRAAMTSPQQVALISQLATDEAMAKAPREFAEVVRQATAAGGAPVREFWVDAAELQRLNQEAESGGKTEEQLALELNDAAGPDAAQAAKVAVAEGGRFAVPLEQLPKFLTTDLGKALAEHMATSETAPTAAQLKAANTAQLEAIRQHALEMAQKAMEAQADEEGFDDALAQMQRDIVDAGRSAQEARDAVRVIRAFYETAKADNPSLTWKGVLEAAGRLEFAEGDNGDSRVRVKAMQPFDDLRSLIDFGGPDDGKLSVPQRAEMLYRDDVTGLRTPDGWELEGVPDGYLVAQVTTPDAKAVNDNPEGSHDSTNELLSRMGAVVAKADPKAARAGTNFWVRVKDQAALDALVAELRAVMPTGMQAFGAAAATREQAGRALDKVVDDARKAGVSVPRGQTAYKGPLTGFAEGVAKVATPLEAVHEAQVDVEGKFESREAFGNRAFRDPEVPGLLTRLGFLLSKPAAFVASLDLRGIRDTNIEMGKRAGDALLKFFGDRLVAMGGHAFAAAHMSGDEYAMKSDSKEALIEMLSDLRDELENMAVPVDAHEIEVKSVADVLEVASKQGLATEGALIVGGQEMRFKGAAALASLAESLPSGSVDGVVRLDAQSLSPARFRFGIGEGTYGKADRDLNRRKQLEAGGQAGQANVDGRVAEGRSAGDDLRERRSALEERRARAQYRGAPAANPFVDVAEGQADELSFDPGGAAGDSRGGSGRVGPHTSVEDAVSRPAGEPLVDPETLAQFRENVSKMRATKRRARLQAFLSYIEGTAPRPKDPADGSTVAGLTRDDQQAVLKAYGIDDPLGTFLSNRQLGLPNNPKRDPTKKKSGWTDKGMQAKQEDENMALQRAAGNKSPLDRLYQQDQGVASLPAGQPVLGRPDTTDLTALLSPAQREQGLRVEVQRMPGREESKPDKNGRVKFGRRVQTLRASLLSKENPVAGEGEVIGSVAPGADGVMELNVSEAEIGEKFQNQRLGLALYEALYRQALDLGAVRVVGGAHTLAASRVHQSLTRKLGLTGYEAKPTKSDDGKLQPYSYNLQPDRLFQQDLAADAFKPIKLSSGLLALLRPFQQIGTGQDETGVMLVDFPRLRAGVAKVDAQIERLQTTAAQERPAGETPPIPGQPAYLSEFLRLRRQQIAESQAAAEAAAERGAIEDYDRAVHAIELEEREALWAAREFLNLNEDEVPADRRLSGGLYDAASVMPSLTQIRTEADPFLGKGGPFTLSEDDKQDLLVALDQFESQTGRLYQQDIVPGRVVRRLSDGRALIEVGQRGDESLLGLVKDPPDGDVSEEWLSAALKVVEGGGEAKALGEALGRAQQALEALEDGWTGTRNEVRAVFDGDWREWSEERRNTVADDWAQSRADAVDAATEAIAAATENRWADALDLARQAMRLEAEWGDSPGTNPIHTHIKEAQAIAEAGAGDLQVFTLSEARTGSIEGVTPEVLVALDEYEAATGRMKQDEANMASTPRGYFIRPPPGAEGVARVLKVFLNKKADASTVMHESAHGFLEMLHNLASTEGAGLRTKQQWADTLKWLGVESYAEIKREHHERFAPAFEAYLREGRAPKKDLFSVFNRFKAWLTRIYKSVTQLNVELDENVKRIFDRMLATDEEIMRANGKRGAGPWQTAEEAGMTPEAWQEYQEADREALAFATREAAARFTRQALDDAEKDWKEQVDAARADAVAEFEALPARKAQRFLEGKAQDLLDAGVSMAPVVLDREAVERAVGASGVKKFRTRRGGANPDEAAQLNGYPTGPDMLRAITQLPAMDKWVEQRAQALAEERDAAGAAELARLRKEVEGGVQRYVEERIEREWAEFGRRAEPGSDVSPLGRQVALETLKRAARLVVERQRVGTLSTSKVLARERAAAVKVRNAARTGNLDAARDWFREQSLQAYAHGATIEAIKERDRFEKMASGLTETAARARLGKASPALRDAVDYLLGAFALGEPTDFTGETLQAAAAVLEESGGIPGDWFEALQMPELVRVGDWRNLSVANLRHLDAALRQLTAEARFRNEVQLGEKKAEREAVVEQLVTEAREVLPARTPPGTRSSDTALDTLSSFANKASGWLLNPADLVRDLTSDNLDSTWWKAIIEPLRLAKYREAEFLKRAVEPVIAAIEALPESAKKTMRDAVDGKRLFPNHIESLLPPRQRYELLMMALNAGNEGNLQRLTDGRRITVEEVARALDTLTDDELKWVESVWDAVSTLKEDAFALEERETGLRPRGVDPVPFRLPSGRVLKGGYFPAVYDARASLMGEKQQIESVAATVATNYTRPGTSHGYVKQRAARVEDAAISLDLGVIYRHLAQVAHDVAQREAVKSVASLVLDKRVQSVMRERLGDGKTSTFLKWLRDVGGATGADTTPFDGLIRYSRSTFSHIILGWKAATALGDFANLPAAVATTPLTTKHLTAALRDFWSNPFTAREKALEASPWLRTMKDKTREQYDTAMRNMLQKGLPKPLQWYKDMSFFFMETVSVLTATPVWMGAHQQAVSEGRTQEDAVKFADDILSRVFPSHAPVDQAGILRDKGLIGLSTVMYGYLSVAYRAQHRLIMPLFEQEFLNAPAGQKAATVGTVAGRLLGFYVAYSVLGELLMGRGPEAGDDDEEEPGNHALRWRNWFMRKLIAGPLATVPVYDFARAFEAAATGKPAPSARSTPLASVAELLSKEIRTVFNSEKSSPERVYALAKLPLEGMGISFVLFDTQGKWLIDVALGNVQVNGPGDVASGLIYGQRKDQPANLFRPRGGE